jgi:putative phosphoesterase
MSLIAIFSDVHGNLPALEAVLKDINYRKVDQVYCLGDLVDFAPWTNEVIDLIRSSHITCLMGNHDERVAFDQVIMPLQKHNEEEKAARVKAINYTKRTITACNKRYLAGLPLQLRLTFDLNGLPVQVVLVHASPNSNDEYIYEDHAINDLQQMMDQYDADILVMRHTHLSYIRTMTDTGHGFRKMAINCGSVGRSKEGTALASYLLLDINRHQVSAKLIKPKYSIAETFEAIKQSDIPNFYADFLLGLKKA